MDKRIIFAGLSLLLTACGGINYVGIETCNPGEVTFPKEVKKVLMVNNAVAQPEESGYTYTLLGIAKLVVLLFVSVLYLLYLLGLLMFPLSGFLFKFKYAVL